jgi:hypothetical protein
MKGISDSNRFFFEEEATSDEEGVVGRRLVVVRQQNRPNEGEATHYVRTSKAFVIILSPRSLCAAWINSGTAFNMIFCSKY